MMKISTEVVDEFEYKGKKFTVHKDGNLKHYLVYNEGEKKIHIPIKDLESFMKSSFSHTTINESVIDVIEKSIKINDFLYNLDDLKKRLKKYK